ncbi:MAG: acyl carrier protein [Rickettsia endosymbiont of Argas persicus]
MNTTDNIEQEVIKIIAEKLNLDESKINKSSSFADDLKADSLDTVELMMEIEAKCGIDISDEEAAKLKTVENVIDYIKKHKA